MIVTNEFLFYDPLMMNMRNNYLLEASELLTEALPYQKNNPQADSSWYIKWKGEYALTLKNSFSKFRQYAASQNIKYTKWLRDNREYFDARKYNPGNGCSISSAPNYTEAIARIKKPISVVINGEALNRINVPDANSNAVPDNRWFYKTLIPEYNGTGDDFMRFARAYYNGLDNKRTISAKAMASFIPIMFNFCINYMSTVQVLEGQLNSIIGFANRDPVTGVQNPSDNAEKQLRNLNQQNANNKYASTNPNNNVVHASVDYLSYRESCMILNELGSTAPVSNSANTVNNTMMSKPSNTARNVGSSSYQKPNTTPNTTGNKTGVNLTNDKVNQKQLAMKKKQTAANIVKDAFLCKLTASNAIYRDFITTLQVWANGVQEQIRKSNQKTANKKSAKLQPQQQVAVQQQQVPQQQNTVQQ